MNTTPSRAQIAQRLRLLAASLHDGNYPGSPWTARQAQDMSYDVEYLPEHEFQVLAAQVMTLPVVISPGN